MVTFALRIVRSISSCPVWDGCPYPCSRKLGTSALRHCATLFCGTSVCSFSFCMSGTNEFHARFGRMLCISYHFRKTILCVERHSVVAFCGSSSIHTPSLFSVRPGMFCKVFRPFSIDLDERHPCTTLSCNGTFPLRGVFFLNGLPIDVLTT